MSFLGRFLKKQPSLNTPNIPFGRYSDSYKSDLQYDHWEAANNAFDEENYIASLTFFLDFLKNDQENNVEKWSEEGILNFKIIQGSKKIIGRVHGTHIEVEAKVAKTKGLRLEFMHFLMSRNYSLRYSRFALDGDNDISVRFDTELMDASPYKLYNALKEVATNADKLDDLLVDEYSDILFSVDNQHIEATTQQEKDVKYQFTHQWIKEVLLRSEQLDRKELDAGIAYLLLDLTYKLDYLIQPQGFMMESLERVHRQYFASDNKTIEEKCDLLLEEYKKIYNRPKEEFVKEIYHTIATFGITSPVNHDRVANFIDGELPNMDWYLNHNYPDIALAISGYIAGYCMFEFAVPQVDRCLFHLYFEIVKNDFFNLLGFNNDYYNASTAKFNKTAIKQQIQNIFKANQRKHPLLKPNINMLDFTNLQLFSYSYMKMISALHLSED